MQKQRPHATNVIMRIRRTTSGLHGRSVRSLPRCSSRKLSSQLGHPFEQDYVKIVTLMSSISSLILLDRYLFLQEQGIQDVQVVPCFDYAVSPRNMVIIARKP
jgi:hypothetical protein